MTIPDEMECIRVQCNGEWATVCYQGWKSAETPRYGGEILVHSSYGNFAHAWGNIGVPFPDFLAKVSMESFMNKAYEQGPYVFDLEASITAVRKEIETQYSDGAIDEELHRELLSDLEEIALNHPDEYAFELALNTDGFEVVTGGVPTEYVRTESNPRLVNFWDELWPLVKTEMAARATQRADEALDNQTGALSGPMRRSA